MNDRAPIQRQLEATFLYDATGEQAIVGVAAVSPVDPVEAWFSSSMYWARLHTMALDHHHTPPGTAFQQMQIPRGLQCWQLTSFCWFKTQACWSLASFHVFTFPDPTEGPAFWAALVRMMIYLVNGTTKNKRS